jgi:hypothetical protein
MHPTIRGLLIALTMLVAALILVEGLASMLEQHSATQDGQVMQT